MRVSPEQFFGVGCGTGKQEHRAYEKAFKPYYVSHSFGLQNDPLPLQYRAMDLNEKISLHGLLGGPPVQVAYFVDDCREAAATMARDLGAGPFFVIERIELAQALHRGQAQTFIHSSAYGQWGGLMMELVSQDEPGPSPFRDMFAEGETGLHHLAFFVQSLSDTYRHVEQAGFEIATRATTLNGTEFGFIDAVSSLGHMLEVYEPSDGLQQFYAMVREASFDWQGDDPVRKLG